MVSIYTSLTFFGLTFLMALSPGPNLLYLASRSVCQGRAAGFSSLCGVCTGMLVYMLATVAGLSSLFVSVPVAYDVVRFAGAAYLIWLAYKAFTGPVSSLSTGSVNHESRALLFRRGLMTCLLNPKIVVTYGAFLPQFVDPSAGLLSKQLIILGLVQICAAALAHSLVILGASTMKSVLKRNRTFASFQRFLLGTVFTALAARLVFERQNAS